MKRIVNVALAGFAAVALAVNLGGTSPAFAEMKEKTVTVGGAPMYPSKNIVQNAVNSKDHTTLVAAVKAAGLVDTLQSAGPFTVFAPVNAAFAKLPAGTVDSLLKPEMKATLTKVLTYHVVAGKWSAAQIMKGIKDSKNGKFEIATVSGGKLWLVMPSDPSPDGNGNIGASLRVTDSHGNVIVETTSDSFNIYQAFSSQTSTRTYAWNQFSLAFGGVGAELYGTVIWSKSLRVGGQGSFHCSVSGHCSLGGITDGDMPCIGSISGGAPKPSS